jgi:hypothetical protein
VLCAARLRLAKDEITSTLRHRHPNLISRRLSLSKEAPSIFASERASARRASGHHGSYGRNSTALGSLRLVSWVLFLAVISTIIWNGGYGQRRPWWRGADTDGWFYRSYLTSGLQPSLLHAPFLGARRCKIKTMAGSVPANKPSISKPLASNPGRQPSRLPLQH